MTLKTLFRVSGSIVAVCSLMACVEGSGEPPAPPPVVMPPPPPPAPIQDQFGTGFKTAFEQDAYAEPTDPIVGDIIDLDKTTDPVDVPDP